MGGGGVSPLQLRWSFLMTIELWWLKRELADDADAVEGELLTDPWDERSMDPEFASGTP